MKPFKDYESKKAYSGREQLPVGGYVCNIISAKEEANKWGSSLIIAFDVCEGEYTGIFKRDYENNDRENKKWRGTFRLNIPKDDGSDQDAYTKRRFGNTMWAIEQSNPGYVWNWDEKSLKGKKIGIIFRNEEWAIDGRSGWSTRAGGTDSIDNIRSGKFRPLSDKPLRNRPTVDYSVTNDTAESEEDLPF